VLFQRDASLSAVIFFFNFYYYYNIYIYIYIYINADDLVLLGKKGTVLQSMIDRIIERGRCYGMEVNVEKTEVMRIPIHSSPVQSMIDKIGLDDVEYVFILGRMMIKDVQV